MKKETSYDLSYDFEYKGYQEDNWYFPVTFEMLMEGIRQYFYERDVNLDGKDSDVWNALFELGGNSLIDDIFDEVEQYLTDTYKDDAYEAFKEEAEYYLSENE